MFVLFACSPEMFACSAQMANACLGSMSVAAKETFQEALGSLSIAGTHPESRLGIDLIDRTGRREFGEFG
jgi:hypothetical protein